MKKRNVQRCLLFILILSFYSLPRVWAVEKVKLFRINDLTGSLKLVYQSTEEKIESTDTVHWDSTRRFIEGGIRLITDGSIYHSNLLTFYVDVNVANHRSKNTHFSDASINNSINNSHDIRLNFLQRKKIKLSLYTKSQFYPHDRVFVERFFSTSQSSGLRLSADLKLFPFDLDIYNTRMKSESFDFVERDEETDNINLRMSLWKGPGTQSFFTLRNKKYFESVNDVRYRSLSLLAYLRHGFSGKKKHGLTSTLSYNRIKGNFEMDVFNFRTSGSYYFNPRLDLNTTYILSLDKSFDRSYKRHELTGRLSHRLFDSLTSQVLLQGRLDNSTLQRINTVNNQFIFHYTKKIPTGRILVRYINSNEWSKYTSRQDISSASREFYFTHSDTVILTQPGLHAGSIRVTDPRLSYVYIAGIDYQVDVLGTVITITRLPGGGIPPGGDILVYYEYLSYPDFRLKLHSYIIDVELRILKFFNLNYEKRAVTNTVTSDYLVPALESYDRDIYGVKFNASFLRASYTLERYKSNLSVHKTRHLGVSGHLSLFKRLMLTANVSRMHIQFENIDFFNNIDNYSIECRFNPVRAISSSLVFRKIDYETPLYLRNRESLLVKFQWVFRRIILDIFYEHMLSRTDIYEKGRNYFSVVLRRTF